VGHFWSVKRQALEYSSYWLTFASKDKTASKKFLLFVISYLTRFSVRRKELPQNMGGCCSYPNGRITAIPALLSIVTTVLSTRAWYSCDYFQVDVQRPYQNETLKTCGVGLFWAECSTYNNAEELTSLKENCVINPFSCSGHASNEVCSPYPQRLHQAMDPSFKTARAFGV